MQLVSLFMASCSTHTISLTEARELLRDRDRISLEGGVVEHREHKQTEFTSLPCHLLMILDNLLHLSVKSILSEKSYRNHNNT